MKAENLMRALNDVDYDLVESAEQAKKQASSKAKWCTLAAGLALVLGLGALLLPKLLHSERAGRYKEGLSVSPGEYAIVWPWELKTPMEQYPGVTLDGKSYVTRGREIRRELLGEKLGRGASIGYDEYTEKSYPMEFDLYAIRNVDPELLAAVNLGESCVVYRREDRSFPATLGALMDALSLPQTLPLDCFCSQTGYQTEAWYQTDAGAEIWKLLSSCRDAACTVPDHPGLGDREAVSFLAQSEALGIYAQSFSVTEDGFLLTNILEYGCSFHIGRETAGEIFRLLQTHRTELEQAPQYSKTVAGTLTEVGEDYLLIDDSVLCRDSKDGIVYRVSTEDLRIRRCLEFPGDIHVGDIVVVEYEGSIVDGTVTRACSLCRGVLTESGVAVPE